MIKLWIWLASRPKLRKRIATELIRMLGDIEAAYLADESVYRRIPDILSDEVRSLCDKNISHADKILLSCQLCGISILTYGDPAYPDRLRHIVDPPMVLYYKGILPDFDKEATIAMVGTRNCSSYGIRMAQLLSRTMAQCGALIVSGMAVGIDYQAAKGALRAGGFVVGVLACGADVYYPSGTRDLRYDLERFGCIITEYPPGTKPHQGLFVGRNRIISGLSCGVLVVEAGLRSGALITARHAVEQGRNVYAVPGNADSDTSKGCNLLISEGAKTACFGWDIMQDYVNLYPGRVIHWQGEADVVERRNLSDPFRATIRSRYAPSGRQEQLPGERPEENCQTPQESEEAVAVTCRENLPVSEPVTEESSRPAESEPRKKKPPLPRDLSEDEAKLVALMGDTQVHVDEMILKTELPANRVLVALTMLETRGVLQSHPGKFYSLRE